MTIQQTTRLNREMEGKVGIGRSSRGTGATPTGTQTLTYGLRKRVLAMFSTRSRQTRLRMVETLTLGPKRQVSLIECDGHSFLIGAGADGVSAITMLPPTQRAGIAFDLPSRQESVS